MTHAAELPPETGLRRLHPLVRLALLALAVAAMFAALALSGPLSAARVRDWIGGGGVEGAIVFVALSSALTVACFPGPLLAAAAGVLFGTALGTPLSIAAATFGAILAFTVARVAAGDTIARVGGERLSAASAWVSRNGFVSVLYARIAPAVPYTLVNYAAGLSPVGLFAFTAATVVGVAPRAFAYTALGGNLSHLDRPAALVAVGVLVAEGLLGVALMWKRRAVAA